MCQLSELYSIIIHVYNLIIHPHPPVFARPPVTTRSLALGPLLIIARHSYCAPFLLYMFSDGSLLFISFELILAPPCSIIVPLSRREGVYCYVFSKVYCSANIGAPSLEPGFSELRFPHRSDIRTQWSISGMLYPILGVGLHDVGCDAAEIAENQHFGISDHRCPFGTGSTASP